MKFNTGQWVKVDDGSDFVRFGPVTSTTDTVITVQSQYSRDTNGKLYRCNKIFECPESQIRIPEGHEISLIKFSHAAPDELEDEPYQNLRG